MSLPPNANYFKLISHKSAVAALKTARVAKDLTGKDAAEMVGLTQPQLSRIENGHQAFFTDKVKAKLDELAKMLEVQPLRWTEADWREGEREAGQRRMQKQVTTPARTVAAPSLNSRASVSTLLDLYDAGVLNRDIVLDALTNLTKEQ
jgi:transcriptional regulator with XRE-family HTH domain